VVKAAAAAAAAVAASCFSFSGEKTRKKRKNVEETRDQKSFGISGFRDFGVSGFQEFPKQTAKKANDPAKGWSVVCLAPVGRRVSVAAQRSCRQ
jgi:hypothetical protein